MTLLRRGNRELIRQINRNLVLNLIKSRGPISRSELAKLSGLSPAAISGITGDFIAGGLVEESGEGESRGGRRPVLLRLNHRAGFVVGLKLMEETITSAVTDLDAQVLHHQVTPLPVDDDHSVKKMLPRLIEAIEDTIATSGVEAQQVLGIGMGMAGVVDGETGVCRYSPFFDWRDVQIAEPIAEHFDLPVYLENDVNTLTIAEKWFGYGSDVNHFVVVTVGRGVGAGLIVNGQIYRGAAGGAGEFGHIPLLPDGPQCDCGKRGCLEALTSDPAIVRRALDHIAAGQQTELAQFDEEDLNLARITAAADAGDPLAQELLASAGHWLGVGIATLVNLLNPQLVIVGGEGVQAGEWRLGPMREAFESNVFDGLGQNIELLVEPSG
ncbi:MAG: ROK family protein, partial [Chloroflexota bacterium]